MIHLVEKIIAVEPYQVSLLFNTGEELIIDLEEKLQEWASPEGSIYRQLLNREYFRTVTLDQEAQTICWDNGIDLCPDVLYEMSQNKAVQKEYPAERS